MKREEASKNCKVLRSDEVVKSSKGKINWCWELINIWNKVLKNWHIDPLWVTKWCGFSYLGMNKEYPRNHHIELDKKWLILSRVTVKTSFYWQELWLYYSTLKYNPLTSLKSSNKYLQYFICAFICGLFLLITFSYTSMLKKMGYFSSHLLEWLQLKFYKP